MKITYEDKVGILDKQVHTQEVWDDDINEIKEVVNNNDDNLNSLMIPVASQSNTVKFDRIGGYTHGTRAIPIDIDIYLDLADSVHGSVSSMIWSGSSEPLFDDGLISNIGVFQGAIDVEKINIIYFHNLLGKVNINILQEEVISATSPTIIVTE